MVTINTLPPSGMRDFLPEEVKLREQVFAILKNVFEDFGFEPLQTPAIERIETLTRKYGQEGEKLIFKILQRGGKAKTADLGLRYDLTVPLARVIAEHFNELPRVFKRYQIGPVWRAERPGKGRFREFYQCDIDIIGSNALIADAEIIIVLSKALKELGIQDFVVELNSRKILAGFMKAYGVPKPFQKEVLISFDKLNKIGIEGVKSELRERGLSYNIIEKMTHDIGKTTRLSLARMENIIGSYEIGREGLEEVKAVKNFAEIGMEAGEIAFNPVLVRGLAYYTGPIFEVSSSKTKNSLAGGGRYDNLIGMFLGRDVPACGGSLGIERILLLLKEQQVFKPMSETIQILITVWGQDFQGDALRLATALRKEGLKVEVFLGQAEVKEQLGYASRKNIPYVVLLGPREKAEKRLTIRDMRKQEQKTIPQEELVPFFKNENF